METFIIEKPNEWANVGDSNLEVEKEAKKRFTTTRHEAMINECKVVKKDPSSDQGNSYFTIRVKYTLVNPRRWY